MKNRDIAALEAALGYRFRRPELLRQALTHSSHAREAEQSNGEVVADNEQLEFLGDAVLGFVTSQELFRRFPDFREGELSKLRAHLVSQEHLISAAQELELGGYLQLGRGEEKSGGRNKTTLLVDALEAVLAAMYLDGGLEAPQAFILARIVGPELERLEQRAGGLLISDYKSALQETAHTLGRAQPAYVLVSEEGPEHRKIFTVEARIRKQGVRTRVEYAGRATGPTKKKAEQDAARQALEYLWSVAEQKPGSPQTRKSSSPTASSRQ